MVQIIQGFPESVSPLEALLSGVGQGFAQSYPQQQQLYNLGTMLGLPEEQAQQFAKLPPAVAQDFAKEKFKQQRQTSAIQSILGITPSTKDVDSSIPDIKKDKQTTAQLGKRPIIRDSGDISDQQILAVSAIDPKMATLLQQQKEQASKSEIETYKLTKEYRDKIRSNYNDAIQAKQELLRMDNLADDNKLISPITAKVLDRLGIPIGVLNNPDSEEFEKLAQNLTKNIRSFYGARISNLELTSFMKTIPTLMNSQEGRKRLIKNLSLLLEPRIIEYKTYQDIVKEYKKAGKKPPMDIDDQVSERMQSKLDSLAEEFLGKKSVSNDDDKVYLDSLPPASEYNGATATDSKTGQKYQSNGKTWRKL